MVARKTKGLAQSQTVQGIGTALLGLAAGMFLQYSPALQLWLTGVVPLWAVPHVPWLIASLASLAGSYAGVKGRVNAKGKIEGLWKKK